MNKRMLAKSLTGIAIVLAVVLIITLMFNNNETTARQDAADAWKTLLEKQQFEDIPNVVTKSSITDNDFTEQSIVEKYTTIFNGIGAKNVNVSNMKIEELKKDRYTLTYTMTLETALGKIESLKYSAPLVEKGDAYAIKWNPTLIFPHMQIAEISLTAMINHSQQRHRFIKWAFYQVTSATVKHATKTSRRLQKHLMLASTR